MQTKDTPLYRKHLTEQQITNICKHLAEKKRHKKHRTTHRTHRDTIGTLLEDLAEHATEVSEYLMQNIGLSQFECDELWTFIKKKEKTLKRKSQIEPENGDCYLYTTIKRKSYLLTAFSAGKWTQQTCLYMIHRLAKVLKVPFCSVLWRCLLMVMMIIRMFCLYVFNWVLLIIGS